MTVQTIPTPELYFETMFAHQRTSAMKAALELDLFTAIDEGAAIAREIAKRCGASERGTRILCDFLVIHGFLTKKSETYALTPDAAMFLSRRSPAYLGSTAQFLASSEIMRNFESLADTIRRGTIAPEANTVSAENPIWVQFARSMMPMMFPAAQAIADIVGSASGPLHVLDIAAGHGIFGVTLAQRNPKAQIVAQDWAPVLQVAIENARKMGVGDRIRTLPGDAFNVEFGKDYDVVLVTNFIHHFDHPTCVRLLQKIAAALKSDGRVVILEFVPNEDRVSPPIPAGFSLTMLAGTPQGDAYTFSDIQRMLSESGFKNATRHSLPPPATQTVVVGTKA
jgi:2-polyprenyl-3-methyl-5-hydroxy-6-metoxy-1,4-benzoquinol methylase